MLAHGLGSALGAGPLYFLTYPAAKRSPGAMNQHIFGGLGYPNSGSHQTFSEYRQSEVVNQRAVNESGNLLDYTTLELRVHPPNVQVDLQKNETRITVDSANRPGTLVEVRACSARRLCCSKCVGKECPNHNMHDDTLINHQTGYPSAWFSAPTFVRPRRCILPPIVGLQTA